MKATVKSITLDNFKGAKSATYTFDGKNATVTGCNGAGKTTIADSYFWTLADKNFALASNPNIRPIGEENCAPSVEIVFDIDGRELTVFKKQKCTVKKSKTGGADTISISNIYAVNFAECGKQDFEKKMRAYGFDFDLFLALSHPNVFTGQKAIEMRKILFGMASEKSDYEIAVDMDGIKYDYDLLTEEEREETSFEDFIEEETRGKEAYEVGKLLKDYTADEVKTMQNAALRKIREVYGKDGEILRAEIKGKEGSKTDIDVVELESTRKHLDAQIIENKAKQEDVSKEFEGREKIKCEISTLKSKLNELVSNEESKNRRNRIEIKGELQALNYQCDVSDKVAAGIRERIRYNEEEKIPLIKNKLKYWQDEWIKTNEEEINGNEYICPTCKRELAEDGKKEVLKKFESRKKARLEEIEHHGSEARKELNKKKKEIEDSKEELKKEESKQEELLKKIEELDKQLEKIPESIDISDREDVKEIKRQISEKEASLKQDNGADEIRQRLKSEGEALQKQADAVNEQFALVKKNEELDAEIAELRTKQRQYEQEKADAERILYQLDLISRKKNELLTDEINQNFDIVRWQLFEYKKNGEYKNICVPLIDGKRFGESTNTGREILAKLEIINSLQRFYGQSYPVFLDNSECLSEETKKRINMNCQIVYLSVSEDKELRIEVE